MSRYDLRPFGHQIKLYARASVILRLGRHGCPVSPDSGLQTVGAPGMGILWL
jgi:hypothetical protein